jgi:hypothetical protein
LRPLSGPVYLAETLPFHRRGWGLGIFNDCYYVGRLAFNENFEWRPC